MLNLSRRKFLAGAATAAFASRYSAGIEKAGGIIRGTDMVKLGPGGLKTSFKVTCVYRGEFLIAEKTGETLRLLQAPGRQAGITHTAVTPLLG